MLINGKSEKKGSLLENFEPPVNPPKEIDDPEDSKPDDWVDEATIPDPEAKKVCQLFFSFNSMFNSSLSLQTGMRMLPLKLLTKKP